MPHIEFRGISKTYPDGTRAVRELGLAVADGEFLCILGPSGCGKSSTLRMLAGLEPISAGELLLDGRRVNEVPARRRDMAMVFENYALYPHLNVYRNIAMPLAARRMAAKEVRRRVEEICRMLRLTEHLGKRPQILSGGQRQRVALGRALVREPRIFLMDEPLGHLEAYLRVELRSEIQRLHQARRTTTVYITHDQQEAAAIADRIAVMRNGALQQVGTFLELYDRPANRFVATFVGEWPLNVLPIESLADHGGSPAIIVGGAPIPLTKAQAGRLDSRAGAIPVELGARPEDLVLLPQGADAALNGRVLIVEPQGDRSVVVLETTAGRVRAIVGSDRAPRADESVGLRFAPERAHLFAVSGENVLAGLPD